MRHPFHQIVLFCAALLIATACGTTGDREPDAGGEVALSGTAAGLTTDAPAAAEHLRLEHDGVSIELPSGWEGRILSPGILQAANFRFAPVGVDLPAGEEDPIKAMTADQALMMIVPCGIVSFEEPPRPAPARVSLDNLRFLPSGHPRVPVGHAFAHGSFDYSGRCLRIEADFGSAPPEPELKHAVNEALGSLSVAG